MFCLRELCAPAPDLPLPFVWQGAMMTAQHTDYTELVTVTGQSKDTTELN